MDEEDALEVFAEFLASWPGERRELERLISEKYWPELKNTAHRIKGVTGNLRLEKISGLSREIEEKLDKGDYEKLFSLVEEMNNLLG